MTHIERMLEHGEGLLDSLQDALYDAENAEDPEQVLDRAIGLHMHMAGLIEGLREMQGQVKDLIGDVFVELGTTEASTPSGTATVTSPHVRISYDRKGLDALCETSDEMSILLEPYRRETQVAGSLRIMPPKT